MFCLNRPSGFYFLRADIGNDTPPRDSMHLKLTCLKRSLPSMPLFLQKGSEHAKQQLWVSWKDRSCTSESLRL